MRVAEGGLGILTPSPGAGSGHQLHEIAVRIAFADYHPAAAKFARHAEIANRATVRGRASVHCDFCSNEGHEAVHLTTRRNRRELHVTLNERLHRFAARGCASLRHEASEN